MMEKFKVSIPTLLLTALLALGGNAALAAVGPFVEEFGGKQLDKAIWETAGDNNSLFTVRDGSLRLIAEGEQHEAIAVTKRNDLDFFKSPLTVIWDLDAARTLAGPFAPTPWGRIYAGIAIGGKKMDATAAQLGLSAWPEGFPRPKIDATWFYTLNLGQLTPGDPLAGWRIEGIPTRITWTINATDWTVTIEGAKFTSGDAKTRSGKHGLNAADFAAEGFRLKLFASPFNKSVETGHNHICSVVYNDAIRVLPAEEAAAFAQRTPASNPAQGARTRPVQGIPLATETLVGPPQYLFGINYSGNEFKDPNKFDVPSVESLDYYAKKGVLFIRLPFSWERLQPKLMGDLNESVLVNIKKTIQLMGERKMKVMLDMHNFARYRGKLIGSPEVPLAAFTDAWKRIAAEFKDNPTIWGLELMNEPHNTDNTWPAMAQAGIDGIRAVDSKAMIVVCADSWSATYSWKSNGGAKLPQVLHDPANNLCYDGHCYFDWNASGIYQDSYEYNINRPNAELINPMIGVKRIQPFVEWLKANNQKGVIGEFGAPANLDRDPRWLEILENVYEYLGKNGIPSTYWTAGTQWHTGTMYLIEPADGKDRPQMQILLKAAKKYAPAADSKAP